MSKEATLWFYPVNSLQGEKTERRLSTSRLIIAQRSYTIINVRTWIKKAGPPRPRLNILRYSLFSRKERPVGFPAQFICAPFKIGILNGESIKLPEEVHHVIMLSYIYSNGTWAAGE